MSAVDEIAIKLGLQTGDLKAALLDANADIKTFGANGIKSASGLTDAIHETHSAMRLFHQFMVAGGIIEAIRGFYEMAISYAEKHTEDTDQQTQAVREFADELHQTQGSIGAMAVQVLGLVNEAGMGIGMMVASLVHGREEAMRVGAITEDAQRNITVLAAQREATERMITQLETENAATAEKNRWIEFEALDSKKQEALLEQAIIDGVAHAATLEENSIEFQHTKQNILEYQGRLIKLQNEDTKAQTEELKRQTEEQNKQAIADEKYREKTDEEYAKLRFEALPLEEQMTYELAHQADLQSDMAKHKENSIEYEKDYIELAKTDTQLAATKLAIEQQTTKEIQTQISARSMTVSVTGAPDYASMSSAMLQGVIAKQNALLNTVTAPNIGGGGNTELRFADQNDTGNYLTKLLAEQQLAGAEAELNQRSKIQAYAAQFGQDAAVGQFGDNAVNRAMSQSNTTAQNTLNVMTSLASTLNKVFPNQATPIPATTP